MTDVRISRACNAARKQGVLDGLRKAAALVCKHCAKNFGRQPIKPIHKHGRWYHATGAQTATFCRASAIHTEIAATPKHGAPPARPAKAKSQDQDMVMVCASCLQASCVQGIFYCEDYKQADITHKPRAELEALALEHPSYWEGHS